MNIGFVLIFGAMVGFVASKIKGSGLGLWWDISLGVAGSTFASFIIVYGYLMNVLAKRGIIGINLYNIAVEIIGALLLIYGAWFYNKVSLMRLIQQQNIIK